jgi:hypothetical protein
MGKTNRPAESMGMLVIERLMVPCTCGCGTLIYSTDQYARPRRFVSGHNGRVQKRTKLSNAERFWRHVLKTDTCWLWTGHKTPSGYGTFSMQSEPRYKTICAHHFLVGKPLEGHVYDHLCRERSCVRPDHLEMVTHRVNILRGIGLAAKFVQRTHCKNGHPFDSSNTRLSKGGGRICRTCQRARNRRRQRTRRVR